MSCSRCVALWLQMLIHCPALPMMYLLLPGSARPQVQLGHQGLERPPAPYLTPSWCMAQRWQVLWLPAHPRCLRPHASVHLHPSPTSLHMHIHTHTPPCTHTHNSLHTHTHTHTPPACIHTTPCTNTQHLAHTHTTPPLHTHTTPCTHNACTHTHAFPCRTCCGAWPRWRRLRWLPRAACSTRSRCCARCCRCCLCWRRPAPPTCATCCPWCSGACAFLLLLWGEMEVLKGSEGRKPCACEGAAVGADVSGRTWRRGAAGSTLAGGAACAQHSFMRCTAPQGMLPQLQQSCGATTAPSQCTACAPSLLAPPAVQGKMK